MLIMLAICLSSWNTAPGDDSFDPLPILTRMDRNGDGVLDPAEIPAAARQFVTEILDRCDLDAHEPVKLDFVEVGWKSVGSKRASRPRSSELTPVTAVRNAYNLVGSFDRDGDKVLQSDEWKQFAELWTSIDLNQDSEITVAEMAVHLFQQSRAQENGAVESEPIEALPEKTVVQLHELAVKHVLNPETANTKLIVEPDQQRESEQTAEYAYTLLKRYDKDGDDLLDRTEASALGDDWRTADINRDGKISADEMTVRFRTLRKGAVPEIKPGEKRKGILQDLPEVFFELDTNHDHQIQMHEFSSDWSDEKVVEFLRYDANEDYVITPREWLEREIRAGAEKSQTDSP
jgi:Ca2+-binding EF-hand superfamily protein